MDARAASARGQQNQLTSTVPLNSISDDLNDAIDRAESALARLGIGIDARVQLTRDPVDYGGYWYEMLALTKYKGEWRLLLESGADGMDAREWREKPLGQASRHLRVLALQKLPELHGKIAAAAGERLTEIQSVLEVTDAFLDVLEEDSE